MKNPRRREYAVTLHVTVEEYDTWHDDEDRIRYWLNVSGTFNGVRAEIESIDQLKGGA
jgi:hypothetical protein